MTCFSGFSLLANEMFAQVFTLNKCEGTDILSLS